MKKTALAFICLPAAFIFSFVKKQTPPVETWSVVTLAGYCADEVRTDGKGEKACFTKAGPLTIAKDGTLYLSEGDIIRKISTDMQVTTLQAPSWERITNEKDEQVTAPLQLTGGSYAGLIVSNNNELIVSDRNKSTIFKITSDNRMEPVAANTGYGGTDDGPALEAEMYGPNGMCKDKAGNIYIADGDNCRVRKLSADGKTVSTLAGTVCKDGFAVGTAKTAKLKLPWHVAADSKGNVYVAQHEVNDWIIKISPAGVVTLFVGDPATPANAYKDATGKAAGFSNITAMCMDAQDNLYVAEKKQIRKVTPAGVVTTIIGVNDSNEHRDGTGTRARFTSIGGMCCDVSGNIYVADKWSIRKVSKQ